MRQLATATALGLVVITLLWMALGEGFITRFHAGAGPFVIYLIDLPVLVAFVVTLGFVSLRKKADPVAPNRLLLWLIGGYVAYQLLVVLPVAVLAFGIGTFTAARELESRIALVLIPFFYLVAFKYVSPRRMIRYVDWAAIAVVVFAVFKFATIGPVGTETVNGVLVRLREVGQGAALLVGWLVITSLLLRRPSVKSYVLALTGLFGLALANIRSAYLALLLVLVLHALLTARLTKRSILALCVLGSAATLVFTVSPVVRGNAVYSLTTMLNPSSDQSARDRVQRSTLAWDYIKAHPLGDHVWTGEYYLVPQMADFPPHDWIVLVLDTQGVVGAAFYYGIIGTALWIGWRNRARDRISAVMLFYFVFFLVFCLFNTNLNGGETVLLLVLPISILMFQSRLLAVAPARQSVKSGEPTQHQLLPQPSGVRAR